MRSIAGRRTARLTAPPASDTAETNTDATYSLTLSALGDCVVDLLPLDDVGASMPTALTALYAEDLQRTVMLLPRDLKGSVMLSRLRRCIVVAGCQQVSMSCDSADWRAGLIGIASRYGQFRIHESHDCLILLDIPSHPILERCKGLRFGAYPAGLGGLVGDKVGQPVLPSQRALTRSLLAVDRRRAMPRPRTLTGFGRASRRIGRGLRAPTWKVSIWLILLDKVARRESRPCRLSFGAPWKLPGCRRAVDRLLGEKSCRLCVHHIFLVEGDRGRRCPRCGGARSRAGLPAGRRHSRRTALRC